VQQPDVELPATVHLQQQSPTGASAVGAQPGRAGVEELRTPAVSLPSRTGTGREEQGSARSTGSVLEEVQQAADALPTQAGGPLGLAAPPPRAEGLAGPGSWPAHHGAAGVPPAKPSSPEEGGSPWAGSVQGATSPSTLVPPASSPSTGSSPLSSSPSPVSTLQQPPPAVPPLVVQPTVRRSGRYALAEDGSGATDDDIMQRAMRRKAEKNLDTRLVINNHPSLSLRFQILVFLQI
jgi:hypothetical protein